MKYHGRNMTVSNYQGMAKYYRTNITANTSEGGDRELYNISS